MHQDLLQRLQAIQEISTVVVMSHANLNSRISDLINGIESGMFDEEDMTKQIEDFTRAMSYANDAMIAFCDRLEELGND